MDHDAVRFDAFKDAVSRCRWFILATVIVSSLILFHTYLERWSYAAAQLQEVLANRISNDSETTLAETEKKLKAQVANKEQLDSATLKSWAQFKYTVEQTNLDLKSSQQPERSLPFLDLKIPFNDYLPIMAVMLTVFTIGVWLNVRSIWAAASTLLENVELKKLTRVHFTFTGVLDHPSQKKMADIVQLLVLWLPTGVLAIAIGIDFWFMWDDNAQGYTLGPPAALFLRIATLLVMLLISALASWSSYGVAREIDRAFATPDEAATPNRPWGPIRFFVFRRQSTIVVQAPAPAPEELRQQES